MPAGKLCVVGLPQSPFAVHAFQVRAAFAPHGGFGTSALVSHSHRLMRPGVPPRLRMKLRVAGWVLEIRIYFARAAAAQLIAGRKSLCGSLIGGIPEARSRPRPPAPPRPQARTDTLLRCAFEPNFAFNCSQAGLARARGARLSAAEDFQPPPAPSTAM